MVKQKLGKKDIFAPVGKIEKEKIAKPTEVLKSLADSPKESGNESKIAGDQNLSTAPRMIIHSFRIREDLVDRLREYAFFEKIKIYKVINQAVEDFLRGYKPKKRSLPY